MNRAQIRDATYDRLGLDDTDARMTTQRVNRLVNDAIHWIETQHEWPWLQTSTTFSTVSGTGTQTVPTDWLRTWYLKIDQDTTFQRFDIIELEDIFTDSSERGQPWAFAVAADTIYLRPIPDAVYTVTHAYLKRESDLTADDQSPLMPASFHPAIAEIAAYLGLRGTREDTRAQACLQAYNDWSQRMLDDRRRTIGPGRIRIRPGSAF